MSPVSNFTTAPIVGSQKPFKFIVYGDMGVSSFPRAKETAELMLKEYRENDVKFIFHNGDISYARGQVRYFINVFRFHNGFRYSLNQPYRDSQHIFLISLIFCANIQPILCAFRHFFSLLQDDI